MPHHTVAFLFAPLCSQPERDFAYTIISALRKAGVAVACEADSPGGKRYKILRDLVQRDRIILLASDASLSDGNLIAALDLVQEREAANGGDAYILPIAWDVDIQKWIATHQIGQDSPIAPLADLVFPRADRGRAWIVKKLLAALEK